MQIDSDKHQLYWMLQMAQNLQMDDVAFCSRDYGMLSMSLRLERKMKGQCTTV
jgi:hypothetical protein